MRQQVWRQGKYASLCSLRQCVCTRAHVSAAEARAHACTVQARGQSQLTALLRVRARMGVCARSRGCLRSPALLLVGARWRHGRQRGEAAVCQLQPRRACPNSRGAIWGAAQ